MRVLVVTETDACCGPMAAAFLNDYSTSIEAVSVGKNPSQYIDSLVVDVMKECLVDLDGYVPQPIGAIDLKSFDAVYECPDSLCPISLGACRELRDYIKNEAFVFFKNHL